jgi:translocator protein
VGDDYRALVQRPPQADLEPAELGLWACMTAILGLAAWSGVLAWANASSPTEQVRILVLFGINVLLHMLWSPLFFNLRRPDWALIEVPFLWLSIVALMLGLAPLSSATVWLLVPYLLWVTFAALLNLTIVRMNGPFSSGGGASGSPMH